MNGVVTLLLVAVAGGVGAAARFVVDGLVRAHRPRAVPALFPLGTVVVNVTGSLLVGLVTGVLLLTGEPETWRVVLAVGLCGGYTTFSAAMAETVWLVRDRRVGLAVVNTLGTLGLTIGAVAAGIGLVALLS